MSSTLSQLIPLLIFFVVIIGFGIVAWHIWLSVIQVRDAASQRMEKQNVVFTKDGVRVGVKHIANEKYVDQTQSWVVKAWNLSGAKIEDKSTTKKRS